MTQEEIINPYFSKKINRAELLNISSWALQRIADRLAVSRFREKKTDSTELKFYRILFAGISSHAQILKDEELDKIEERLKNLEAIANEKKN
ncbi:hypothetical protein [Methanosarcina sp. UBA5]|uniref:hypothetical protein n=1 Tax=Methanosarcina sp. UBA5 TaxID=1915593 RepID=UPI0025CF69DE|nr:hypothetical protein [Methanosarcina sp. UBA5]